MIYPWSQSVFPIAALFSFRMLGLFMLIPVFTVYAPELQGATATLTGIALGCYGLSQGLLQIPFGLLSDRFGRKTMIYLGLVLFILGSLLGAVTDSIYGMIAARILQGMGAIGSVLIALLADLTPESDRTKAMAVIGITIGLSFGLAMVISPSITAHYGLSGIFYCTTFLALCGLVLLHRVIPSLPPPKAQITTPLLPSVLSNKTLFCLNAGIFLQHVILTTTFFVIPLLVQNELKLGTSWQFYVPIMLLSFLLMMVCIHYAEKKRYSKQIFKLAIVTTAGMQFLLAFFYTNWWVLCSSMLLYFIAFNILEANLPSLVSKEAPVECKGTAIGVYSSCQFLGIFAGGVLAGLLYQYLGTFSIFFVNGILATVWLCYTGSLTFALKE